MDGTAHLVAIRVKESLQINYIRVGNEAHDLELTVLEPLVLQDLLDRDFAVAGLVEQPGLEDDAEGAIADDFAVGVGEISLVAALAVGGDDLDDLTGIVDG